MEHAATGSRAHSILRKVHTFNNAGALPGICLTAMVLLGAGSLSALAANEWGYENEVPPPTGMSAGPALSLTGAKEKKSPAAASTPVQTATPGAGNGLKPDKGTKTAGSTGRASTGNKRLEARALPPHAQPLTTADKVIQDWLKLYAFAGSQELDDETKTKARNYLKSRVESPQAAQISGILDFWPRVESAAAASQDQKENYKALLRALLRIEAGKPSNQGSEEPNIIAAVLGPARIAAQGTPPLTEDAIESYANMACFLYEQSHPGKTVDATDNRMVFAGVIRTKFIEAPSQKDRESIANFDLNWARFKILWSGADQNGQQKLLAAWTHKDGTAGSAAHADPTLDAVLHKGPWVDLR